MKYARIERERRYLLPTRVVSDIPIRTMFIQDRYIIESTLRLRRVEELGKPSIFKFGQKIRIDDDLPLKIAHTTLYISEDEFKLLVALPAEVLEKRRSIFPMGDVDVAVDEFGGVLTGLVLAEIDLGEIEIDHGPFPFEKAIEVTRDERFTGGALAATSFEDLRSILMEYGVN